MKSTNIIHYARTCLQTFDQLPFNEIDAAVLSQMAYLYMEENFENSFSDEGMPVYKLLRAELFEEMCRALALKEELTQLIYAFASSPRFRDVKIKYYRNELNAEISLQFAAVVYSFSENMHCICYRGTDKTFIGWKEDLLLYMHRAASCQMMAANYLNGVGAKLKGDLYLAGHSKGGHLSSYAASHCKKDIQDRIVHIYNLDGPGFNQTVLESPGMDAVRGRITKYNPSDSPIADIMQDETDRIIIKSSKKGLMSHNVFSWEIQGNTFVPAANTQNISRKIIRNINNWAATATDEEISIFAEIFFGVFESSDFESFDEFSADRKQTLKLLTRSIKETNPAKRKDMFRVLQEWLTGNKKRKSKSMNELPEQTELDNQMAQLLINAETEQFNQDYSLFL